MATAPALMSRLRSEVRGTLDRANDLVARYESLKAQRAACEFDWQDIVRYLVPGADDILTQLEPGQSRTEHIFDGHPLRGPQILAANMMGAVTNQFIEWRKLKFHDEALNDMQAVNAWLTACDTRIMAMYAASNFYQAAHTYYLNLGAFGTAAMYVGTRTATEGKYLHFRTLPTASYVIAENADGLVDTLCREVWLTPRQALQLFRGGCSDKLKEQAQNERQKDQATCILHCVYPRRDRNQGKYDNGNMPFAGVYVEKDTKHICDETGFHEFPYMVSRWETMSRSPYGYGPGHAALPDVRMLNALRELHMQQLALWVQPPLEALQEGVIGNISLESRAVNVVRQMGSIKPLDLTGRPDLIQLDQADLRRSIDDFFFVNALQALPPPDASTMTAYEVAQRIDLMTRTMGPVFYRLLAEFLNPVEDRVFGIAWREDALPQPPREVLLAAQQNNGQLDVDYNGPLARAQRGDDVKALSDLINLGGQIVQIRQNMDVLDNIDWDLRFRRAAEILGTSRDAIIDMTVVEQTRQARQQQAAQMQQAQQTQESLGSLGKVAPLVQALQQRQQGVAA